MFGIEKVSDILGFNLFLGTSLDLEKREKLRSGLPVSYQSTYNFDEVRSLQVFKTNRIGKAYFDFNIIPVINGSVNFNINI